MFLKLGAESSCRVTVHDKIKKNQEKFKSMKQKLYMKDKYLTKLR
jgi:predicted DNA-binding protein YlxM (UPF0122 family)